jgi:hypothetical protein
LTSIKQVFASGQGAVFGNMPSPACQRFGWQKEAVMNANVGNTDRLLRIVTGIILIALVFVGPKTPLGWIGLVPLFTGLFRWCPAYRLLGINTCPRK